MERDEVVKHEYEVEYIIDKATVDGKNYFGIKWKHYDNNFNTWEPEENIDKDLIREFERARKDKQMLYKSAYKEMMKKKLEFSKRLIKVEKKMERKTIPEKFKNPFKTGLVPTHVVKVDKKGTKFVYTIKWTNGRESKITSAVASRECPQLVLDFYFSLPSEDLEEI